MTTLSTVAEADVALRPRLTEGPTRPSAKIGHALLVVSALCLCLASLSIWRFTFDDSYIGFRFAENIAKGLGAVFNAGQRVEGYTSFLWVVLLAGAARLGSERHSCL